MKFLAALAFFAVMAVALGGIYSPYYGGYYGGYSAGIHSPLAYSTGYYGAPAVSYTSAYASPYYGGLGYGGYYGLLKK